MTVEPKMLERVRALLAKAESTTFEEEALALTAKAQELMAKYAIDHALLAGADGPPAPGSGVDQRAVAIDDPYASAKSLLLATIADANGCRALWSSQARRVTVFGYDVELDTVELLYTSLLVQATNAMVAAGPQRDPSGRSRTRSFRHSFLVAYANRIGQRLTETVAHAVAEADAAHHGALLPVLASRQEEIDAHVAAAFPRLTTKRVRAANAAGWHAGTIAADRAELAVADALAR